MLPLPGVGVSKLPVDALGLVYFSLATNFFFLLYDYPKGMNTAGKPTQNSK